MSEFEKIDSVTSSERLDVIFTIVPKGKGEAVTDVLRKNDVLECLIFHGHGTAPSNILKMLGLGVTDKEIVLGFTQNEKSHDIIKAIDKKLNFENPETEFPLLFRYKALPESWLLNSLPLTIRRICDL